MANLKNNIINTNIAGDTSNILIPDSAAIASGVVFKSNINSNVLNGYYNSLSEAVQYLQFTGGLYSEQADYNEGNIVSLVIKNSEDYSIWQFRRNANNPQVLNNNPPISGASITTENGVNVYEGGTLNTDWDKLTEDYAVEATPNTVMGRDSQGASNVNMPSGYIPDTTIVNHKYMVDTFAINNQYIKEKIQEGLDKKQDKLTAGTNITIENNVISASGNLATKAELVSFDNSEAKLQQIIGYDFPKFKVPIADENTIIVEYLPDEPRTTYINKIGNDYFWQREMTQVQFQNGSSRDEIKINLINVIPTLNNYWYAINFFLQFFNFSKLDGTEFIELDEDEMQVETYTGKYSNKCSISFELNARDGYLFLIINTNNPDIISDGGNVTINIKNRVLRPADRNIFSIDGLGNTHILNLKQTSGYVKLVGTVQGASAQGFQLQFYSDIIENYFNMGSVNTYVNTTEITSSTGKAIKYALYKNGERYSLALYHQDGTAIEADEVFTFNLTPDKNAALDPIYQNVTNVQQMGEALNDKLYNIYDLKNSNTQKTGTYTDIKVIGAKKQVVRNIYNILYDFILDNKEHIVEFKQYSTQSKIVRYKSYLKQYYTDGNGWQLTSLNYTGSEGYINVKLKRYFQPAINYKLTRIPIRDYEITLPVYLYFIIESFEL